MVLEDLPSLNNPEYDCNYCNNKKNMNDASGTISEEPDGPGDNQDYRYDIK